MSFKMPITTKKLPALKAKAYIKMLSVILSKKFLDGMNVPFIIVLNHKYADMNEQKSEKVPLFLVGNRDGSWKDFHKQKLDGNKTQKEFTVSGMVRRNGSSFILEIDGGKGIRKVPNKPKQFINVLLKKIDKTFSLGAVGDSAGNIDETLQAGKAAMLEDEGREYDSEAMRDMRTSNEGSAYKKANARDAKQLSKLISSFSKELASSLKIVAKNVKSGVTSSKDLKIVKEASQTFSSIQKVYESSSDEVKQKFKTGYDKLSAKKIELAKLALAAKKRKKSVAQMLADTYYQEKESRIATTDEIKQFNTHIKNTIKYNKKSKYKTDQSKLLQATSFVLRKVGIDKYSPKLTDKVLSKLAA